MAYKLTTAIHEFDKYESHSSLISTSTAATSSNEIGEKISLKISWSLPYKIWQRMFNHGFVNEPLTLTCIDADSDKVCH